MLDIDILERGVDHIMVDDLEDVLNAEPPDEVSTLKNHGIHCLMLYHVYVVALFDVAPCIYNVVALFDVVPQTDLCLIFSS